MKTFKLTSIFIPALSLLLCSLSATCSAAAICSAAAPAACSAATCSAAPERAAEVLELVNSLRAEKGLSPLRLDGTLCRAARFKAEEMAETGRFSHVSAAYGSPEQMLARFGARFRCVGENIALGYESAASVMADWASGSGHRANILCPAFVKLGVGFDARAGAWVQIFTD